MCNIAIVKFPSYYVFRHDVHRQIISNKKQVKIISS